MDLGKSLNNSHEIKNYLKMNRTFIVTSVKIPISIYCEQNGSIKNAKPR